MLHYEQRLETDTYLQKFETEYNKIYSRFYRADGKRRNSGRGQRLRPKQKPITKKD